MIDTDKYEGHTEGPWEEGEYTPSDEMIERFQNRELQGAVMQQGSNLMLAMIGLDGNGEKDRLLIADAPKLLAEVKRLRELKITEEDELEKLCNRAEYYEGEYNLTRRAKQELLVEVKRLRDGIQHWFDTVAHREDDVMVQYFKRLIE